MQDAEAPMIGRAITAPLCSAIMVVTMQIRDQGWLAAYGRDVGPLLAEYGATCLAAGTDVEAVEGNAPTPDRVAVFAFPDMACLHAFMADARYRALRSARQVGSTSEIVAFANAAAPGRFA